MTQHDIARVNAFTWMCIRMHGCMNKTYAHAYVHLHIPSYTVACMHIYTRIHVDRHMQISIRMHMRARTQKFTNIN